MNTKAAYALGWAYGAISRVMPDYDKSGIKFSEAGKHPLVGFAQIHEAALKEGKIDKELADNIGKALERVDIEEIEKDGNTPIPIQMTGSWQLGCMHAQSGKPLDFVYSVKEHRAKSGLTQEELAAKMNVTQEMISRWENGLAKPNEKNIELLKKILGE